MPTIPSNLEIVCKSLKLEKTQFYISSKTDKSLKFVDNLVIFQSEVNPTFLDAFDFKSLQEFIFDENTKLGTTNRIYQKLWALLSEVQTNLRYLRLSIENRYFDQFRLYHSIFIRKGLAIGRGMLILKGYGERFELMRFLKMMDPLRVFSDLNLDVREISIDPSLGKFLESHSWGLGIPLMPDYRLKSCDLPYKDERRLKGKCFELVLTTERLRKLTIKADKFYIIS